MSVVHGSIDKVPSLRELDLLEMFSEGIDELDDSRSLGFIEFGFKQEKEYYRKIVTDFGFVGYGRVIDMACGYGRHSVFLAEVNDFVYGIDFHPAHVHVARKLSECLGFDNTEFAVGSAYDIPADDDSFDAAWCFNALHLMDRGKTLREMARVLKPGGRVLIGAYNSVGRWLQKMCEGYKDDGWNSYKASYSATALEKGPLFNGAPHLCTVADIGRILAPYGFVIDPSVPIVDQIPRETITDEESELLSDTTGLVARFREDEQFRHHILDNYNRLMRGVDYNPSFVARLDGTCCSQQASGQESEAFNRRNSLLGRTLALLGIGAAPG